MSDKCIKRVEALLKDSSIKGTDQDEIINQIKLAQAEKNLANLDEINVDEVAKEVSEQLKLQKKINKRNAIENEIKVRQYIEHLAENFSDDPEEGMLSVLVGSEKRVTGARASVAAQQQALSNQLLNGFTRKLKNENLEAMFAKADVNTQRRIARTMEEIGLQKEITEKNSSIVRMAEIMEEYSEDIRTKLNDRGANVAKLWGYIVRQSHDPYMVRDAAGRLGKRLSDIEIDPSYKGKDINYQKNFQAWKEFILPKLDEQRTFANVDNIDQFLLFAYNSLVHNDNLKMDGVDSMYGSRTMDYSKRANPKRVLHFKSADDWFDYNSMFGERNLNESFMQGLHTAARNIGMMDILGTKPQQAFEQIRKSFARRLVDQGRDVKDIDDADKFTKYMMIVDGSIYSVKNFTGAKWAAITRAIMTMSKLGGATISAVGDVAQYASEMRYQGRTFLGGMAEAFGSLSKLKNSKQKKEIAEFLGFVADNTNYDLAGRFQVGDYLNKGWTNIQRQFFKYNLLSWWTNNLKEGAMLGMANYFAKQKSLSFDQLNPQLKNLFDVYNIDANKWDVIRKTAMLKAEDGKEFINIAGLENMTDAQVKKITGIKNMTKREISIEREKFQASVSGMLLDRSTYAVIEPSARERAVMTQGKLAGTGAGEAIRFLGQFKGFPVAVVNKTLKRLTYEMKEDFGRGIVGAAALIVTSVLFGYMALSAKDIFKGRTPRAINKKTIFDSILQGGGLGIYGDVLFQETRSSAQMAYSLLGPGITNAFDAGHAIIKLVKDQDIESFNKQAYQTIKSNVPFLNLFYIKTAFDYLIGYQLLEQTNPGALKRMEKRMRKDYDQEFIFGRPR